MLENSQQYEQEKCHIDHWANVRGLHQNHILRSSVDAAVHVGEYANYVHCVQVDK